MSVFCFYIFRHLDPLQTQTELWWQLVRLRGRTLRRKGLGPGLRDTKYTKISPKTSLKTNHAFKKQHHGSHKSCMSNKIMVLILCWKCSLSTLWLLCHHLTAMYHQIYCRHNGIYLFPMEVDGEMWVRISCTGCETLFLRHAEFVGSFVFSLQRLYFILRRSVILGALFAVFMLTER
jgi:hypothetical protein